MDLEQTVTITTPEGVRLDLTVAGMGSRIAAATIDFFLQAIVMIVAIIAIASAGFDGDSTVLLIGLLSLLGFLVFFGYPILTEVLWEGKSVGKAAVGLRVVRTDGGGIGFVASLIRNVLRLVDFLPSAYGVGFVVAMINDKGQRLGDLAADTIVVRQPKVKASTSRAALFNFNLPPPAAVPWDVSAVTPDEVAALRHYAERRQSLELPNRARLADTLYDKLKDRVVPTSQLTSKEAFLLQIIAEKERDR